MNSNETHLKLKYRKTNEVIKENVFVFIIYSISSKIIRNSQTNYEVFVKACWITNWVSVFKQNCSNSSFLIFSSCHKCIAPWTEVILHRKQEMHRAQIFTENDSCKWDGNEKKLRSFAVMFIQDINDKLINS